MESPSPMTMAPSPSLPSPSKQPEEEEDPPCDEEEEEEEDDDEEEEPQLKYERIGGDIAKVVRADLVSAFCVGSKVIVPSPQFYLG